LPAEIKQFKSYEAQVNLLASRGMNVGDHSAAVDQLRKVNYYRLSGYWYSFRVRSAEGRSDLFYPSTSLDDVTKLYRFDANLRAASFAALAGIELTVRALVGHALGEVHECAHLKPEMLNARAGGTQYSRWLAQYKKAVHDSHEDFVEHHHAKYGGTLPVWAAVELLDWGGLTRLFGFAPRAAQDKVAAAFGLTAPQMESWLKSLNIVRNVSAHHGRLFNRVFAIAPKLPIAGKYPDLDAGAPFTRTFGQLSMIQHLLKAQAIGNLRLLPAVVRTYPDVPALPIRHLGAPENWSQSQLWAF
jgi:abortive infection bacteriophage resistance protein